MIKELEKQKQRVEEAKKRAYEAQDFESRYLLSLELLKLHLMEPIAAERLLYIRMIYGLKSVPWILAEKEIEESRYREGEEDDT
ncbi:hypothetical protein [Ruminococcus sp. HUN007]|uniref:hypothetical protein n=1 Tax=Ruminococcus sp. HUN007 TaxID=1514668 RepID=UPI0005D1B1FA|nr:hypothetical protein [Ruminococcus sp. HUN007]